MAIRRKSTRSITVDSVRYRWVVSAGDEEGLGIVVEHHEQPAQRHVTWVEHGVVIAPGLVELAIRVALLDGWTATVAGKEVCCRYSGETGAVMAALRSRLRERNENA